jgi:hypothetical protein
LTDEDGRFVIDLSDPSFSIVITKAGYASTVIGPDRKTPARELDVRLWRGAAISGRLVEQGRRRSVVACLRAESTMRRIPR